MWKDIMELETMDLSLDPISTELRKIKHLNTFVGWDLITKLTSAVTEL